MTKLNLTIDPAANVIHMTREFDAPAALVFKAFTDPALLPQWWGPEGMTTVVESMQVKKGGTWRYIQHDAEGNEYAFNGVYHDISAPNRLVYTFEFEGLPGKVLLETTTFEDRDGKTFMTDSLVFQSVEDRDGMMASGMQEGANTSWDRLEALLPTL